MLVSNGLDSLSIAGGLSTIVPQLILERFDSGLEILRFTLNFVELRVDRENAV